MRSTRINRGVQSPVSRALARRRETQPRETLAPWRREGGDVLAPRRKTKPSRCLTRVRRTKPRDSLPRWGPARRSGDGTGAPAHNEPINVLWRGRRTKPPEAMAALDVSRKNEA